MALIFGVEVDDANMLRAWVKQVGARSGAAPQDVFPGHGRLPADEEELRQLRRGAPYWLTSSKTSLAG